MIGYSWDSYSHWGMFRHPDEEFYEGLQWTPAQIAKVALLRAEAHPSYDSRYLHGGQRSTYQRLNFGELA